MMRTLPCCLGLSLALFACGDDDNDDPAEPASDGGSSDDAGHDAALDAGPSAEETAERIDAYVEAMCGALRTCCERDGLAESFPDCEGDLERSDLVSALRSGKAELQTREAGACLAALSTAGDSCEQIPVEDRSCAELFRGTVPEGGECNDVVECARADTPVLCLKRGTAPATDAVTGVCRSLAAAREGERCAQSGDENSYGATFSTTDPDPPLTYCDARDNLQCAILSRRCEPIAEQGDPCEAFECRSGLYCNAICHPAKAEGDECEAANECALGLFCSEGRCQKVSIANQFSCAGNFG